MSSRYTKYAVLFVTLTLIALIAWMSIREKQRIPIPEVEEPIEEVGEVATPFPTRETIGTSVEGRDIEAFAFGEGDTHLLFVGGMHGGYEWNSVMLAYEMIMQLTNNPEMVEEGMQISIIPNINPDGLYRVIGDAGFRAIEEDGYFTEAHVPDTETRVAEARFNANGVDLNRNFDCKWAPESTWRGNVVSAGTAPFSEPEAAALRDYVAASTPDAVVFWHSQANNVYASECHEGVLPETLAVMNTYADAAGYGKVESFDAYPITGDAEGWLASLGIPAVTVELESFKNMEFARNLAGTKALIEQYSGLAR